MSYTNEGMTELSDRDSKENGETIEGGGGKFVEGMQKDNSINILGIPYPYYAEEFPNHVKTYEEKFGKK
jgi:hypothetical protein